jgi:hypothetical protein
MSQEIVNALSEVDSFHKDCMLLFNDIVASIRQNTLTDSIKDLLGPEHWCVVEDNPKGRTIDSSHQGNFVFEHNGRMRFVFMLVKTAENHFRRQSPGFRAICQQLGVEEVLFPLLLVTGVFKPDEAPRWRYNHENYRRWLESTLLLSVPQTAQLPDPTSYALDNSLTIEMQGGDGTQWCETATFTIRQLADIRDSRKVEEIVEDLLKL